MSEESEIISKSTSDDDLVSNEQTDKIISSEQVKIFEQSQSILAQLSFIEKQLQVEPGNEEFIKRLENTLIDTKLFFINITKDGEKSEEVKVTKNAVILIALSFEPLEVIREYNKFVFPILGRKKYQFGQHWREEKSAVKEKPLKEKKKPKAKAEEVNPNA